MSQASKARAKEDAAAEAEYWAKAAEAQRMSCLLIDVLEWAAFAVL